MTHAHFTAASIIDHVPAFADPILAAIDRHDEAWAVFQVAPEGAAAAEAETAMSAALDALLGSSCATRFGGLALLRHLRWWLAEEAGQADQHQPAYGQALARADDLTLFLGSDVSSLQALGERPVRLAVPASRVARKLADGRSLYTGPSFDFEAPEIPPGTIEPWQAVAPTRPDTAHVRSLRFLDGMGEAFAALTLICGGALLVGLATLA